MKILLATDGSECSETALHFLNRFRFSRTDEITLLYVDTGMPYADDSCANIRRFIKKVAPKVLQSASALLKNLPAKITTVEAEGDPAERILEIAADTGAGLIVMGARGIKGIRSFMIGSVTRVVAQDASVPVLVTKLSERPLSGPLKVLFATDGSPSSEATASLLSSLPFPAEAEVTIMHAAWSAATDIPDRFSVEINEQVKNEVARLRAQEFEESDRLLEQFRAELRTRFQKMHTLIVGGDPSEEILHEAEVIAADLIAVGSRGMKGIRGMLGSVSRRVLNHASCAVLIGKKKG